MADLETTVKLDVTIPAGSDVERAVLENAVNRMGWPEINAFKSELRKGQDYREDAGGFWMRAIRRLFGLPEATDEVVNYQEAGRKLIAAFYLNKEKQK